jgi:hypothetical protein
MVMKKIIGKIVVALIKALVRAFFGMLIGAALIGLILIILLFFGAAIPDGGGKTVIFEIVGLLLVGAGIGAFVGFFDMLDFASKAPEPRSREGNVPSHRHHDAEHRGEVKHGGTWQRGNGNHRQS